MTALVSGMLMVSGERDADSPGSFYGVSRQLYKHAPPCRCISTHQIWKQEDVSRTFGWFIVSGCHVVATRKQIAGQRLDALKLC